MSKKKIIRAWKDEKFRLSLSEAERAELPANPAGMIEITDTDVDGGFGAFAFRHPKSCTCRTTTCKPKPISVRYFSALTFN